MSLEKNVDKCNLAVWSLQALLALIKYLNDWVFRVISSLKPFISCVIRNTPVCNDGSLQNGQSVTCTSLTQDTNACLITKSLIKGLLFPPPCQPLPSPDLYHLVFYLKKGLKKKKENPTDSASDCIHNRGQVHLVLSLTVFVFLSESKNNLQSVAKQEVFQGARGWQKSTVPETATPRVWLDSSCHLTIQHLWSWYVVLDTLGLATLFDKANRIRQTASFKEDTNSKNGLALPLAEIEKNKFYFYKRTNCSHFF